MIKLKKKPKESNEKFLSRFQKKVQGSRILMQAKDRMYHKKKRKKGEVRRRALKRDEYRSARELQKYL